MAVSANYRAFILEQLGRVLPDIRGRAMFGGVGVYSGTTFFALIDDDVLYFKVDDGNRAEFAARGMPPFRPFGEGGETMQYHEVPADVIEDQEALRSWAEGAIAAGRRAKVRKTRRKVGRTSP